MTVSRVPKSIILIDTATAKTLYESAPGKKRGQKKILLTNKPVLNTVSLSQGHRSHYTVRIRTECSVIRKFFCPVFVLGLLASAALLQTSAAQQGNASAILSQITKAFSSGKPIRQVQLAGSAEWHAGSLHDSGSVVLTASSAGAATMQLSLAKKGSWTESQSAIGATMSCQWAGNDGTIHQGDAMNCLRPVVWFLPQISLQPASIPTGIGFVDLSIGTVGPGTYRHLQSQAVLAQMPSELLARSVEASTTDIGIDPNTLLPSILRYQVHPDNGAQVNIPIEVRFSDYQRVDGAEVPFMIQRYVNGSLQLEIHISSVQIN